MKNPILRSPVVLLVSVWLALSAVAHGEDPDRERFNRILNLRMTELTAEAKALLKAKYPQEDWTTADFPEFVHSDPAVETGYQVAFREPELLRNIPCYCFCESIGHTNLLHCFWSDGKVGGTYDEHAVSCNICYGQAMLAFLWANSGASLEEIREGMKKKFSWLLERHPDRRPSEEYRGD